jgi:hypothetical protein
MERLVMHASIVVHLFGIMNGHRLLDAMPLLPTTIVARAAKYAFLHIDPGKSRYILLQHLLVTLLQKVLLEIYGNIIVYLLLLQWGLILIL